MHQFKPPYLFPYIIPILLALFLSTAKAQKSDKNGIYYLSDTSLNFDKLVNKFRGKIIYVDIWATWCGPCKQELREAKNIKAFHDFALKNDIVVLYICCDKNDINWKQFIAVNKLAGYHILVNKALNHDFHTTLSSVQNRRGKMKRSFYIPRHIIVDKNGTVADSTAGAQGSTAVYTKLKAMLN